MNERTRQRRARHIIEAATTVFTHKGIEKATMQDVATEANLGVATIFRFFPKKEKLIVAVASKQLEHVLETFQSIADMTISCYEKLGLLFDNSILLLTQNDKANVILLENFDNYAAHSTEPLEDIVLFNELSKEISKVFATIVQQGVEDGSIRKDISPNKTLSTIMNAFALFSRKLSQQSNILVVENDLAADEQLLILKKIILDYLKPANEER